MTKNPSDGETFTLNYHVFEFDDNGSVAAGNIPVQIETSLYQTAENFKAAVTAAGYGVR
jgi:hypothetical protein